MIPRKSGQRLGPFTLYNPLSFSGPLPLHYSLNTKCGDGGGITHFCVNPAYVKSGQTLVCLVLGADRAETEMRALGGLPRTLHLLCLLLLPTPPRAVAATLWPFVFRCLVTLFVLSSDGGMERGNKSILVTAPLAPVPSGPSSLCD